MSEAYKRAGVDVDAGEAAVDLIKPLAASTFRPEVAGGIGGFAGLFKLGDGRMLVSATDGVGTKIEIARMAGRLDTVGIDLVAMCADDVVVTGAEPLFFLDYLAVGKVEPRRVADIVAGVAEGCKRAGCSLLGGETAEHPGSMDPDAFDLSGFCVGVVNEGEVLGPERVSAGDVLVGLESSGLHSNGYSLVREVLVQGDPDRLNDEPPELGRPLVDELLEPTRIYTPLVLDLAREGLLSAASHITGGGLVDNVIRVLPSGLSCRIETTWPIPPIFTLLRRAGDLSDEDVFRTFNAGIGMVLVVPQEKVDRVLEVCEGRCGAHLAGDVVEGATSVIG